jgi:hypothetical protein
LRGIQFRNSETIIDPAMRTSIRLASLLLFVPLIAARAADDGDSVTLRRGPCFGNCPIYEVVLRGDGTARYDGGDYAPRQGRWEGRVDPEAVQALLAQLQEVDFWRMEPDRQIRVQDLPQVVITAERRGRRHRVHTNLPPRELEPIQAAIDSVAAEIEWHAEQPERRRPVALGN